MREEVDSPSLDRLLRTFFFCMDVTLQPGTIPPRLRLPHEHKLHPQVRLPACPVRVSHDRADLLRSHPSVAEFTNLYHFSAAPSPAQTPCLALPIQLDIILFKYTWVRPRQVPSRVVGNSHNRVGVSARTLPIIALPFPLAPSLLNFATTVLQSGLAWSSAAVSRQHSDMSAASLYSWDILEKGKSR